jgi:hypothetical protein
MVSESKQTRDDVIHVDGVRRCLSELRPPTGLLFIPQVIHQHGEQ